MRCCMGDKSSLANSIKCPYRPPDGYETRVLQDALPTLSSYLFLR